MSRTIGPSIVPSFPLPEIVALLHHVPDLQRAAAALRSRNCAQHARHAALFLQLQEFAEVVGFSDGRPAHQLLQINIERFPPLAHKLGVKRASCLLRRNLRDLRSRASKPSGLGQGQGHGDAMRAMAIALQPRPPRCESAPHRIYKHKPTHAIVQCSACYGHE
jgi:hypothetical protein